MENILIRHDWKIARASLRSVFRTWQDRGTVVFALFLFPGIVVERLANAPEARSTLATLAGGFLAAALIGGLMRRRLDFLAAESPFAAEALTRRAALAYQALGHAAVALLLLVLVAIGKPDLLARAAASYAAGIAAAAAGLAAWAEARRRLGAWSAPAFRFASWRRRGRTAALVTAAAIAAIALPPAAGTDPQDALFLAAATGFAAIALLSPVGEPVARFQSVAGYGLMASLAMNLRNAAACTAAMVLATLPLRSAALSLTVAGVACLILLFRVAQIMSFRAFSGKMAEVVLMAVIGLTLLIGATVPPVAPLIAAIVLFWLGRRAARATWLLA